VGVYLRFALGEADEFEDGPDVSTTSGWLAFLDWAEPLRDFPELVRFADECVCWPSEGIARLEAELSAATRAHASTLTPDVLLTVGRLLEALHDRPGGATALIATDGTPGDDDDQDADEDADEDDDQDEDAESAEGRPGPATPAVETPAAPAAALDAGGRPHPASLQVELHLGRAAGEQAMQ
jgi:hypothetical protein